MPYTNTAGIVLKWFRDTFLSDLKKRAKEQGVSAYKLIDELAQSSPAGSNGIVTLPHFAGKTGIERAKGVIYGINLSTALSDIVRSVLESIGCMLFELISEIEKMGVDVCEIRSLGGGGASDIWCEIKAGITSKKIMRTTYVQTTALGAAILGSVAIGTYDTVKDALCVASLKYDEFLPKSEDVSLYKQIYDKYKELYDALKIVF